MSATKNIVYTKHLVVVLVVFMLAASLGILRTPKTDCREKYRHDNTVTIKSHQVLAETARTDPERTRGLSGRLCIGVNRAMLFEFDRSAESGIWMKDMKFSIDIVWLDSNKRIISIKEHASPVSYPDIFYPSAPAKYILELRAGSVKTHGLALGDQASWN